MRGGPSQAEARRPLRPQTSLPRRSSKCAQLASAPCPVDSLQHAQLPPVHASTHAGVLRTSAGCAKKRVAIPGVAHGRALPAARRKALRRTSAAHRLQKYLSPWSVPAGESGCEKARVGGCTARIASTARRGSSPGPLMTMVINQILPNKKSCGLLAPRCYESPSPTAADAPADAGSADGAAGAPAGTSRAESVTCHAKSFGERERERESFIRNNLHNGVVSGAAR